MKVLVPAQVIDEVLSDDPEELDENLLKRLEAAHSFGEETEELLNGFGTVD